MIATGAGAAAAASSSGVAPGVDGEKCLLTVEVALPIDGPGVDARGEDMPKMRKQLPHQHEVDLFYNSNRVQIGVAALICANFLTNMIEKQVDPQDQKYTSIFEALDLLYNVAFTLELVVNLYAHWWRAFWNSNWNIFDVVVVTIGIVNMVKLPLPKAFSLLRMMRAFRVFRLFKRIKSLNRIIVSIVHSIPGVMNAFLILTIIMSIYAILGIEFFKDVGDDCRRGENATKPGHLSLRKFCTGEEYFGTFSKSMYSFFQVLTGESWSELIARPVIFYFEDDWILAAGSALFFVSFVIITGIILTNVVVAILLDKMAESQQDGDGQDQSSTDVEPRTEVVAAEVGPGPAPTLLTDMGRCIYKQSVDVLAGVEQGMFKTTTMQSEFERMKIDMVAMQDKLSAIGAMVEKRQRAVAMTII